MPDQSIIFRARSFAWRFASCPVVCSRGYSNMCLHCSALICFRGIFLRTASCSQIAASDPPPSVTIYERSGMLFSMPETPRLNRVVVPKFLERYQQSRPASLYSARPVFKPRSTASSDATIFISELPCQCTVTPAPMPKKTGIPYPGSVRYNSLLFIRG